jgi:hypothetical protein
VADALRAAGVDDTLASGLTALASTVVGAATGGGAGAAAAFNEVTNNFLSHAESSRRLQLQSEQLACKTDACRQEKQVEIDRLNRLDTWRDKQIEQACKSPASAACQSWTAGIQLAAKSYDGQYGNEVDTAERSSVLNQAFKYQQAVNNPFLHGVGTGLLKLTPPGIAVGAVGGVAAMVGHIQDRGLVDGMIDVLRGMADIPQNVRDRLNSPDPTVRGEALVDVFALGAGVGVATAGGTRLALNQIEKAKLNSAIAKAEEQVVARARVDNNASADADLLSTSLNRADFRWLQHEVPNADVLLGVMRRGGVELKNGVSAETIFSQVIQKPIGERANPSSYLSESYIRNHLAQFEGGASRIMLSTAYEKYGIGQTDGTSFIMSKAEADRMILAANGDPKKLAASLGLPTDALKNSSLLLSHQVSRFTNPHSG